MSSAPYGLAPFGLLPTGHAASVPQPSPMTARSQVALVSPQGHVREPAAQSPATNSHPPRAAFSH